MILDTISDLYGSKKKLFLTASDLKDMQIKKLRAIVIYAYETIPFYNQKFKNAGIKPDEIRCIEDLNRIPLTTKEEIQGTPLSQIIPKNVDLNKCVKSNTSGSTGYPVVTFSSSRRSLYNSNMWLRAEIQNGLKLRDKIALIREPNHYPKRTLSQYFGIMPTVNVSVFDEPKKQTIPLLKEKPNVIKGYPSSLAILGRYIKDQGISMTPRLVFTFAELLHKGDRQSIVDEFETELFDYYGSTELGLISWECREHEAYHINSDNLLVEFLDSNGNTVKPGTTGEIICTSLTNYVMPLIRYRQGDVGAAIEGECPCGIKLPLMQIRGGREDDFLIATNGTRISPTLFFPYPFDNVETINQFRVIQEERDRMVIQLVVKKAFDMQSLENAKKQLHRLFGDDMYVEFEFLERIDREPSGKLRKIVSKLPKK